MTRKEAIEAIKYNWPDSRYTILREALDMAVKALDAVPVVRCMECKKHSEANGKHYCKFWRMYCPDDSDFFCKAGERKEGADNDT